MKQRRDLVCKFVALLALGVAWFAAISLVQPPTAAAQATLQATAALIEARIEERGGGTRILFDITAPVRFELMALTDPYRIVIELEELRWQLPNREIAVGDALVSRVRYGLFRPGTSRIVLDCARPAVVDGAYVTGPRDTGPAGTGPTPGRYQLVVDLAAVSHAAFVRSLEAQTALARPPDLEGRFVPAATKAATNVATSTIAGAALPPEAALFVREVAAKVPSGAQLAALPFAPPPRKPLATPGKRIIVIDPGHGGSDPGAVSASGVYEKTVTLRAARLVQEELRRSGRYNVMLTRNGDESLRLRDRVAFARTANADFFISLHADANPNKTVRGASVYTLSEKASDAEAAALAERENKADLIAGVDLSHEAPEVANILINLAQRETMNQSARVAKQLVQQLGKRTTLVRNTHRFAGFAVLTAPDVPAVLVELGHLSNREDERLLQQEGYLRSLAAAIAETVNSYFTVESARRE